VRLRPWHLIVGVIVVIIGMAALATGGEQPGSVRTDGAVLTKTVSRVESDSQATFRIRLQEGGDAAHESAHIFDSLESPAIARIALDTGTLDLTVAFDSAQISEDAIRAQLTQSGYLARSIDDAVPAELSADGASQAIHLTPGDALEPSFVRAKAGVPLMITFSPGEGHLASVSIPVLGVEQDLTVPDASIVIEDPAPGQYELVCAEGYADAVLVVE